MKRTSLKNGVLYVLEWMVCLKFLCVIFASMISVGAMLS